MGILNAIQGDRVYLDTNIFIYGIEGFALFEREVGALFEAIDDGDLEAVTSELTLAEALVKPLEDGNTTYQQAYEETLQDRQYFHLMPVVRPVLMEAARLRASTSLRLPDAIHAASAQETGCTTLVTNDTGFKVTPNIHVVILSDVIERDV